MVLADEFGTGQVFWSFFWFFLFVAWISLIFAILSDVFRSDDLSGGSKAGWTALVIFLPYLGVFAYLIVHGAGMGSRRLPPARSREASLDPVSRVHTYF